MKRSLSYSDVFLYPQYSEVHSRKEIDTSVRLGDRDFRLPAVPANMKCTIDDDKAKWFNDNGYFYIMHRFGKTIETRYEDMWSFVERTYQERWKTVSISIGVQDEDIEFLQRCSDYAYRLDFITIDIAHGDSSRMREMLETIKDMYFKCHFTSKGNWTSVALRYDPFIIAGNVASPDGVANLESWGADATKVGIAQGGACTTYGKTGFGVPQFSCVLDCAATATKPIIADGGIKTNGDFAKALRAGGTMVMAGSLFAACVDSPAPFGPRKVYTDPRGIEHLEPVTHKKYFGSASATNKGSRHHVEGTTVLLPVDPLTYAEKMIEIEEDLQSAMSYSGGSMTSLSSVEYGIR